MKLKQIFYTLILGNIFLFGLMNKGITQTINNKSVDSFISEINILVDQFNTDEALTLLEKETSLFKDKESDILSNTQRNKLLSLYAQILELHSNDIEAINILLDLETLQEIRDNPKLITEVKISLARLYEKNARKESTLKKLNEIKSILNNHQLDTLLARYYIRRSSYHRIMDSKDSSLYFANIAEETSLKYNLKKEYGVSQLLLGLINGDTNLDASTKFYKKALTVWRYIKDYNGIFRTHMNISTNYMRQNNPEQALVHIDSSFIVFKSTNTKRQDKDLILAELHEKKSMILEKLNKLDASIYHLKLSKELGFKYQEANSNAKIVEIEESYKNKEKLKEIEFQKAQLKKEKEIVFWLKTAFFAMFLGVLLLLTFYFTLRTKNKDLHKKKNSLAILNNDLEVALEKESILQNEVHHRVKNNYQNVLALLELQSSNTDNTESKDIIKDISNRIHSMATLHDTVFTQNKNDLVSIKAYFETIALHLKKVYSDINCSIDIKVKNNNMNLDHSGSLSLGIILNELITNSFKYAIIPNDKLLINVDFNEIDDKYIFKYGDNGEELQDKENVGFGTMLINGLTSQLKGKVLANSHAPQSTIITFPKKQNTNV